jgi:hypothetical protein
MHGVLALFGLALWCFMNNCDAVDLVAVCALCGVWLLQYWSQARMTICSIREKVIIFSKNECIILRPSKQSMTPISMHRLVTPPAASHISHHRAYINKSSGIYTVAWSYISYRFIYFLSSLSVIHSSLAAGEVVSNYLDRSPPWIHAENWNSAITSCERVHVFNLRRKRSA